MRNALIVAIVAVIGLCDSSLAATRTPARSRVQAVTIILSDYAFTPRDILLHHGQAYQLRFVNQGSGGHNFSAPEFFAAAQISPTDAAAIPGGKVELGKGESRIVRLVPAAGRYGVTCTHFLHAGFGMTGTVTVN
jgi:plastocyanin